MKKTTVVLLSIATLFGLNGCGTDTPSSSAAKTYAKTPGEVYTQSCYKCHGDQAQGLTEKKTPPMNDRQAGELELDLYDVKNDGLNQSSGTEHDKMAHNMQKLLQKGYDYDPKAMAEYIEKNFYKMPPKTAPAAEAPPAEGAPDAKAKVEEVASKEAFKAKEDAAAFKEKAVSEVSETVPAAQ